MERYESVSRYQVLAHFWVPFLTLGGFRGSFSSISPLGLLGGPEKDRILLLRLLLPSCSLSLYSSRQMYVPWHDGDSFGMDGTQIGVFEQTNQVGFCCLLQSSYC